MRHSYLLAALLLAAPSHAIELLCGGDLFLRLGQSVPHSTLAAIDQGSGTIRIKTVRGWATGPLGSDVQIYKGTLTTAEGDSYWYNLDRYTGSAMWKLTTASIVEFNGSCRAAAPLF